MNPVAKRPKYCARLNISLALVIVWISVSYLSCGRVQAEEANKQSTNESPLGKIDAELSKIEPELADLAKQIIDYTQAYKEAIERNGPKHATAIRAQYRLEAARKLFALQQKRMPLQYGPRDQYQYAEYERLTKQITSAKDELAKLQSSDGTAKSELQQGDTQQMLATVQRQLQDTNRQLAEREAQYALMARQMSEQRHSPLPAIENAQVKVYQMKYSPPREAAQTIESLIGGQALRVAIDERSNALIVYGKSDSLAALDTLVERLDRQAAPANATEKTKQNTAAAPRSLMVRVFWLADGMPEGTGQTPGDFLPKSVLAATAKLGLEDPRLIAQNVNSLALGKEDAVDFSTHVPAVLLGQEIFLNSQGKLKLVSDDRVQLEMGITVGNGDVDCQLRGSLATPLGHYMVLGTANSTIAGAESAAGPMAAGPGMTPGGAAGGPEGGGRLGVVGQVPGPGGFRGPGVTPPGAEVGQGAGAPAARPNLNTSRFAFVVQIIEGQSFPAEKGKSEGE